MSNEIRLEDKIKHPSSSEKASIGETIATSLENSPHGGEGLEKIRLAKRIRRRLDEQKVPTIEFTASEVKLIEGSMQGTRAWAYEQIIKIIDPAEWKKVMEPESIDDEDDSKGSDK